MIPRSLLRFGFVLMALLGLFRPISAQTTGPDQEPVVSWHNVTNWDVEGRAWTDHERMRWFDRFPATAKNDVTPAVWRLSRYSTGMVARFVTDSPTIRLRFTLMRERLNGRNMSPIGASGFDLYARDNDGKWRWVESHGPTQTEEEIDLINGLAPGSREYALYLPLFNGVDNLEIGVHALAAFAGLPPREMKPIVFYGTSINHGASASRAGMVHTAILGRWFDRPVVNLGFSGNGRMHAEVGAWLARMDAAVFVIDCSPNLNAEKIRERAVPLVKQLRAARPHTPIVLVEDRRNTNSWILPGRAAYHDANHAALQESYATLQAEGVTGLYYIPGDDLLGDDSEGTADGSHPSDLGFMRQAKVFYPVLEEALRASDGAK
jgi:lysophospholipase L1-like esterase